MSLPHDSPSPEAPARSRFVTLITRPFRTIWNQDATFHARLGSVLAIVGLLLGILALVASTVIGIAALSAPAPIPVTDAEQQAPESPVSSVSCEDDDDVFLTCVEGRYRSTDFTDSVEISPASVFEVQLYFENTSDEQQRSVVVRVELPEEMDYVEGSTWLHTSSGTEEVSDGIVDGGLIIGGYLPNGNAFLKLAVRSGASDTNACGESISVIKLITTTSLGTRNAELPVVVRRDC